MILKAKVEIPNGVRKNIILVRFYERRMLHLPQNTCDLIRKIFSIAMLKYGALLK